MGDLFESIATLRFFGDDLDPDRVSYILGSQPTSSCRKGNWVSLGGGKKQQSPTGAWRLKASRLSPGNLDQHVGEIFDKLTDDLTAWVNLSTHFQANMFFGIFLATYNEGVSLSPRSLQAGWLRAVTFDFDIYSDSVFVNNA